MIKDFFPATTWVPTPLTGPSTGTDLGLWWQGYYDALVKLIPPSVDYETDSAQRNSEAFIGLLRQLDGHIPSDPGTSKDDLGRAAIIYALGGLLKSLPKSDQLRGTPGITDALTNFKNASFSACMGIVASLENTERQEPGNQEPFNETFNQLFARERAAVLYELVGDPPSELFYGDTETPDNYAQYASYGLSLIIDHPTARFPDGYFDAVSQFIKWMGTFATVDSELKGNNLSYQDKAAYESQRRESVLVLALLAQLLGQEAKRSAISGDEDKAANAAALSSVLAEGMRGVFGMKGRGKGKLDLSRVDQLELLTYGREKAEEIKEKVPDDPDNPLTLITIAMPSCSRVGLKILLYRETDL